MFFIYRTNDCNKKEEKEVKKEEERARTALLARLRTKDAGQPLLRSQ